MPSRALIYEPVTLQRELLARGLNSLQRGMEIRSVQDVESMLKLLKNDPNWVLVISDTNDDIATISLAKRLRQQFPRLLFVFLMQEGRNRRLIEAFRAGAKGVVYSNEDLTQLAKCIERVFNGEVWARRSDLPMILEGILTSATVATDVNRRTLLSAREEELSELVAEGMSNREISQRLRISESTVKNSLFHIFDKLGISNRVELARYVHGNLAQGERSRNPALDIKG